MNAQKKKNVSVCALLWSPDLAKEIKKYNKFQILMCLYKKYNKAYLSQTLKFNHDSPSVSASYTPARENINPMQPP